MRPDKPFLLGDQTDQRGFAQCMARASGKMVIDIGANSGGYTSTFLEHGAEVIAVEPGRNLAQGLRERFVGQRVTVLQCGVSDRPGMLYGVTYHNAWTLAKPGSIKGRAADISPDGQAAEGTEPFNVTLVTLDQIVEDYGTNLAFVKIDVDGYEPHVIRGGERTFKEKRPDVLIELSYLPEVLGEKIDEFVFDIYGKGYTLATIGGQTVTAQQVLDNYPWHTSFDMLMVPVERYPDWRELR